MITLETLFWSESENVVIDGNLVETSSTRVPIPKCCGCVKVLTNIMSGLWLWICLPSSIAFFIWGGLAFPVLAARWKHRGYIAMWAIQWMGSEHRWAAAEQPSPDWNTPWARSTLRLVSQNHQVVSQHIHLWVAHSWKKRRKSKNRKLVRRKSTEAIILNLPQNSVKYL